MVRVSLTLLVGLASLGLSVTALRRPRRLYKCLYNHEDTISADDYKQAEFICIFLSGKPALPYPNFVVNKDKMPICGELDWYRCSNQSIAFSPITFNADEACARLGLVAGMVTKPPYVPPPPKKAIA